MRSAIAAMAMTIGSAAFQLTILAGKLNHYTWVAPYLWITCGLLWIVFLVSHPNLWHKKRAGSQEERQLPKVEIGVKESGNATANATGGSVSLTQHFHAAREEKQNQEGINQSRGDTRKPRLEVTGLQFINVLYDQERGIWREKWGERCSKAYVIHFANFPYDDGKGITASHLRAQLIWQYANGFQGPSFFPAAWADEEQGMIEMPVGYARKLIIGIRAGTSEAYYWDGYSNPRVNEKDRHAMDSQPLPSHGTLFLKLIGRPDEVWYDQKWKWEENFQYNNHPTLTPL
jgi:hypothetical protein